MKEILLDGEVAPFSLSWVEQTLYCHTEGCLGTLKSAHEAANKVQGEGRLREQAQAFAGRLPDGPLREALEKIFDQVETDDGVKRPN